MARNLVKNVKSLSEVRERGMSYGKTKAGQRSKTEGYLFHRSGRLRVLRDHQKRKKEIRNSHGSGYALQDGSKKTLKEAAGNCSN